MSVIDTIVNIFSPSLRSLGPVTIDAVLRDFHRSPAEVTKFPVESGATISDHVILKQKEYTLDGVVSNTPAGFTNFEFPNFLSGAQETRAASAFKILLDLQAKKEPINVQTGLILYKNMILQEIFVNTDKETAGGLFFTAGLIEVNIANSKSVSVDPRKYASGRTRNQATPPANRGREIGGERPLTPPASKKYSQYFGGTRP